MRHLDTAHPDLQRAWPEIAEAYAVASPGCVLRVTCLGRTLAEQQALYAVGRTAPGRILTHCDGVVHRSRHQATPAQALDFCVLQHGKVSWDPADYAPVGALADARGFVWGGSWLHFKDYPHIEMTEAP